ncbi:26919_t:CDS:2 [Dentiscutata erythropus]|uniref:26919_t:CDS:1 n=1 Tax=Dentiscutata erythropus TaxID=1348616 RepID=A0A9N9FMU9_9GLOM|nr:26919_t:CDS:2 [Dentiscutata erythropus]
MSSLREEKQIVIKLYTKSLDEISLNEVKLAIKSITPKQMVNQIRTSSLIFTKKRKRNSRFWSQKSQSKTKNLNHTKLKHNVDNEYIEYNEYNNDRFENNNEFLDNDRFENNDEFLDNDHFENNDEFLDNDRFENNNHFENNDEFLDNNHFENNDEFLDNDRFKNNDHFENNDEFYNDRFGNNDESIDKSRFNKFPSNIDLAWDILNFDKQNKTFTVCPKCNKLYNTTEIIPDNQDSDGFKYIYKEFQNHPKPSWRKPCGEELLKKISTVNRHVWQPRMQYPLPSIKSQLFLMYQQDGFNMLLQK